MTIRRVQTLLLIAAVATALFGCGSGGGQATPSRQPGAIVLHIDWPARSVAGVGRFIPANAQSIQVTLFQNGAAVQNGSAVIARPTATFQFSGVLPLPTVIQATAFPNADGSGVALATGSAQVNVEPLSTTTAPDIVLASTVATISVVPPQFTDVINTPFQLQAQALDSSGHVVLIDPSSITWSISNTAGATLSATTGGAVTFTGTALGPETVTATYTEPAPQISGTALGTVINATGGVNISLGSPTQNLGSITVGVGTPGSGNLTGALGVDIGTPGNGSSTGNVGVSLN